jgi:hypothetical protein
MTAPAGFASIFPGWNVWAVWQKTDLDFEPTMVGLSDERRLRIWVENVASAAPGAAVSDPANPLALRGAQVQPMPSAGDLSAVERKELTPGPAVLTLDGPAKLKFVRFYNRGSSGVVPWPHDENYLLDAVYQPSETSPITSAPAPDSLAGTADQIAKTTSSALKIVAVVGAVGLVALIALKIASASKAAARAAA